MKNIIIKYLNPLYSFSLLVVLIFYLFPGSIISYLMYGDLAFNRGVLQNDIGSLIHFFINTGGYSINHTLIFGYIALLGFFSFFKAKNFYIGILFFVFLSVVLELFHLIIPNRSFELIDLVSNLIGVSIALIIYWKFKK